MCPRASQFRWRLECVESHYHILELNSPRANARPVSQSACVTTRLCHNHRDALPWRCRESASPHLPLGRCCDSILTLCQSFTKDCYRSYLSLQQNTYPSCHGRDGNSKRRRDNAQTWKRNVKVSPRSASWSQEKWVIDYSIC